MATSGEAKGNTAAATVGVLGTAAAGFLMYRAGLPISPDARTAMDPTKFALNWDLVAEALIAIIILSFIVERALAPLFESKWFINLETAREEAGKGAFKPLIAVVLAAAGCVMWQFDALSIILLHHSWTVIGAVITGAVIAGGSKASLKLFHDVMDVKSTAVRKKEEADQTRADAAQPPQDKAGAGAQPPAAPASDAGAVKAPTTVTSPPAGSIVAENK